jgi:hypothetical protein
MQALVRRSGAICRLLRQRLVGQHGGAAGGCDHRRARGAVAGGGADAATGRRTVVPRLRPFTRADIFVFVFGSVGAARQRQRPSRRRSCHGCGGGRREQRRRLRGRRVFVRRVGAGRGHRQRRRLCGRRRWRWWHGCGWRHGHRWQWPSCCRQTRLRRKPESDRCRGDRGRDRGRDRGQ